jgi:ubiquinone/menaquinone biosynthesis C-methylase UbiE
MGGSVQNDLITYWDSTGEWRLSYYEKLKKTPDTLLNEVERLEKELDYLENNYLEKLLAVGASEILDIGCGVGRSILRHAVNYPIKQFVGVDISPQQIYLFNEQIKKNGLFNITALVGSAEEVPIYNREFDLIILVNNSFGSFGMDIRRKCFLEIRRLLKPTGTIIVGSFTNIAIAKHCYDTWNQRVINIDTELCLVHLENYDSIWKDEKVLIQEFHSFGFENIKSELTVLGCVQTFKKGGGN